MRQSSRALSYLLALDENLATCRKLGALGLDAFLKDELLLLAAEALAIRAGELVKRLCRIYPEIFEVGLWRLVAQNRDKVAHDYLDLDPEALFLTITRDFLQLEILIYEARIRILEMQDTVPS